MKRILPVLLFFGLITSLVHFKAFGVFFAQDDFILINQFSQNNLFEDLGNVFGLPTVTHWRPLDNLYYFIAGNFFNKYYAGYHIFTFLLYVVSILFVYKVILHILRRRSAAFFGTMVYAISPVHFVSLFWISGNAALIAFLFYIISFYLYIKNGRFALIFYFLSLLASEAFFFASIIFWFWDHLTKPKRNRRSFIFILSAFVFIFIKILFLVPVKTYEIYKVDISFKILWTLKYYLLRIFGFSENSGDMLASLVLVFVMLIVFFVLVLNFRRQKKLIIFSLFISSVGLFPFILLKDHASPHYMNLSLFGFALLFAAASINLNRKVQIGLIAAITLLNSYSVNLTYNNSWVVKRSLIAKFYIDKIQADNLPINSTILFTGNDLNASEAYYALGGGEALRFFFKDKNYKICFEIFENCHTLL